MKSVGPSHLISLGWKGRDERMSDASRRNDNLLRTNLERKLRQLRYRTLERLQRYSETNLLVLEEPVGEQELADREILREKKGARSERVEQSSVSKLADEPSRNSPEEHQLEPGMETRLARSSASLPGSRRI